MDETLIASILGTTLRFSTPLILCALAGVLSERSGVIDIGLEGKMLIGAFAGAVTALSTNSLAAAIVVSMTIAALISAMHGFACVTHEGDQVVSGVAINIIAVGITAVLGAAWYSQGGQTPQLPGSVRLQPILPDSVATLSNIPLIGKILFDGLLNHTAIVYLAVLLVPTIWWLLWATKWGLHIRAVGENPMMVEAAGVSVSKIRYFALIINGALCGLAGAYLVLAQSALFAPNMTAGRGFMALAAMIFGKWHPVGALWACLLFGFLDAVAIQLQGVNVPTIGEVPVQIIQVLPYVLTVILLAGFIGRAVAPKALGKPYTK